LSAVQMAAAGDMPMESVHNGPEHVNPPRREKAASQPEEVEEQRLRVALAQREAALMRRDGENFLLGAQVRQLEQRAEDVGRDVQTATAQLAQALQLLDSTAGSRAPVRPEVDRAKTVIASARRTLTRLVGAGGGHRSGGQQHPQQPMGRGCETVHHAGGTGPRGTGVRVPVGSGGDRFSAPRGRPRSPRGATLHQQSHRPNGSDGAVAGLAASAAAAVAETPASSSSAGMASPGYPPKRGTRAGNDESARSARCHSKTVGAVSGAEKGEQHRPARHQPPHQQVAGTSSASTPRRHQLSHETEPESTSCPGTPTTQQQQQQQQLQQGYLSPSPSITHIGSVAAATCGTTASTPTARNDPACSSQLQAAEEAATPPFFRRQRALLAATLRKSAQLQDELTQLRDHFTRKDVIIHGLRHDHMSLRQELELQQQQFEAQQQLACEGLKPLTQTPLATDSAAAEEAGSTSAYGSTADGAASSTPDFKSDATASVFRGEAPV